MNFGKIIFIAITFISLGFSQNENRPNIIYIMADDLGSGDLGTNGQKLIKTPHIDKMASEGKKYNQFYSGSTVCAPARCVLITGLHTGHCRVRGNDRIPLEPEDITIGEVLKAAGYVNGAFGKWGIGEEKTTGIPTKQGFDYFYGYLDQVHAHEYYPPYMIQGDVNNEEHRVPLANEGAYSDRGKGTSPCTKCVDYSHDFIANEVLSFIDRNKDTSFFAYVPFTIPHTKFQVPDLAPYANENWTGDQKIQAAMITRMDKDIGRIFDRLKQHGIADKTITFFTSDNGPHGFANTLEVFDANGPYRGKKRDMYEGGIRVPFIAHWPGVIPAGSTSDYIGWFADMMPTFAALGGVSSPTGIDGQSFTDDLLGKSQAAHDHLYWEFWERGNKKAVLKGDLKAVWLQDESITELYNVTADPSENNNLGGSSHNSFAALASIKDQEHNANTVVASWNPQVIKPAIIKGCMDNNYNEFDPDANVSDPSACKTVGVLFEGFAENNLFELHGKRLRIKTDKEFHIKITDLKGALIQEFSGGGSATVADLSTVLKSGIYYISIKTDKNNKIFKTALSI